jgi:cell division protein FtsB
MSDHQPQGDNQSAPMSSRVMAWTARVWRTAATAIAIGLALLLTWHVVNGKNGVTVWLKKRDQDRQLRREIDDLEKENARLRDRIDHLKGDPEAIEHEAREKLHYARPGEIIYALPDQPQTQPAPAAK